MGDINQGHSIERERADMLFRSTRNASLLGAFGAAIGFAVLSMHVVSGQLILWLTAVVAATLVRFAHTHAFYRITDRSDTEISRWLFQHKLIGILAGISWGLLALHLDARPPDIHVQLIDIIPAFLLLVAVGSYGSYANHYLTFLLATMASFITCSFIVLGNEAIGSLLLYGVLGPALYLTAQRYQRNLTDALTSHQETRELVRELQHVNDELLLQQDTLTQEEEIAKHVFAHLTSNQAHHSSGLRSWNQPMGSLSGDLIQTAPGPDGETFVFLGDFTGHGLPAALGAVPSATIFRAMATKGFTVDQIAAELNKKLYELLPTGFFCCAAVIRLSPDQRHIDIWNGGLPDVMICKADGTIQQDPSDNLPLGIVDSDSFMDICTAWDLQPGDAVYVYSDGLTEAQDIDGEMWGRDRLLQLLASHDADESRLPALTADVIEHTNLAPPSDDISVVEIRLSCDHAAQAEMPRTADQSA